MLRSLSNILRDCVRRSDVVAHYGNEEFLLLLPETEKEVAGKLAEKIRQRVEKHPFVGRAGLPPGRITVSAGVATFPQDADDGPLLMARTNDALSRAKKEGKNRVCLGNGRAT